MNFGVTFGTERYEIRNIVFQNEAKRLYVMHGKLGRALFANCAAKSVTLENELSNFSPSDSEKRHVLSVTPAEWWNPTTRLRGRSRSVAAKARRPSPFSSAASTARNSRRHRAQGGKSPVFGLFDRFPAGMAMIPARIVIFPGLRTPIPVQGRLLHSRPGPFPPETMRFRLERTLFRPEGTQFQSEK